MVAEINGIFLLKVTEEKAIKEMWTMDLKHGAGKITSGAAEGDEVPGVTVTLSERTLIKWLNQQQTLANAFMLRKLKIDGDKRLPLKLATLEPLFAKACTLVAAKVIVPWARFRPANFSRHHQQAPAPLPRRTYSRSKSGRRAISQSPGMRFEC